MANLVAALRVQMGPEAEPLKGWLSSGSMGVSDKAHTSQRWWSDQMALVRRNEMLSKASGRDLVRLDQQSGSLASGWMAVTPSEGGGTYIPPTEYRCLLRWHLGIALLPQTFEGALCPMGCGDKMDVWGDHLVCCRRNKQWERHFGIQDYLGRCLRSHCLPHRLEEHVDPSADTSLRTDVTLCRWN